MQPAKTRIPTVEDLFEPEAWSHLLGQLDLVLTKVRDPTDSESSDHLNGYRRSIAVRNLKLERSQVLLKMHALGLSQSIRMAGLTEPPTVQIAARSLNIELHVLAHAFEECANAAGARTKPAITTWLMNRSQVHHGQAMFLSTL